ncbi:hypothetical protein [Streptomyces sp. DSM 15324]|uniref:hypothetical protein n=1 Tax=Streptomyces sp. DSM 15324 TaxID=1739111 RepID=UPI00074B0AC8|nr:hypothetical protein [Streptomyces sp. DSM 15324]KUO09623.1 hypothetical protein AQJ58_24015 [Streptomyces sp. DSM 15324]
MALLETALARVLQTPGIAGAAVVDSVTGLSFASLGDTGASQDVHDLVGLADGGLRQAGCADELESIVVTTASTHHVTLNVGRDRDPVLLCATVDRDRTNLAWVLQDLTRHADALLA